MLLNKAASAGCHVLVCYSRVRGVLRCSDAGCPLPCCCLWMGSLGQESWGLSQNVLMNWRPLKEAPSATCCKRLQLLAAMQGVVRPCLLLPLNSALALPHVLQETCQRQTLWLGRVRGSLRGKGQGCLK